jgi:LmbE family N-acetylglucosaminyl deacetylase
VGDLRVLVIAAHPDDEVLGCGGTVALHTRAGAHVTTVIACEGESVRYGTTGPDLGSCARRAASTLGVSDVRMLGLPDQGLDRLPLTRIVTPLEEIVREVDPRIIYSQYGGDINRDHQLLFKAMLVASRPVGRSIDAIYAFDTASSTEWAYPETFKPDTWVEITSVLETKLAAMACYPSETRMYPHPRSLEALKYRAKAWGNRMCLDAAEVFMTVRRVWRETPR